MARKSKYKSISQRVNSIYVLIENINTNVDIKTNLFASGYAESRYTNGETMYTEVTDIIDTRTKINKKKLQASRKLRRKSAQFNEMFKDHRALARKVFRDNEELLSALGVSQPMNRKFAKRLEQGSQFYTTAIEYTDVQEGLTPLGLTLEKLQAGLALVKELSKLNADQEDMKGELQRLTDNRNKKLEELYKWADELLTVLEILYKDDKQTLEKFEVIVYSEGYSPKKKSETDQSTEPEPEPTPETPPETPPTPPSP